LTSLSAKLEFLIGQLDTKFGDLVNSFKNEREALERTKVY
jgi:hypothetical protein